MAMNTIFHFQQALKQLYILRKAEITKLRKKSFRVCEMNIM